MSTAYNACTMYVNLIKISKKIMNVSLIKIIQKQLFIRDNIITLEIYLMTKESFNDYNSQQRIFQNVLIIYAK